jgi:hypothetical protein
MRILFSFLTVLFLVSACGQREVLVDNSWILIGGTFQGKRIEFKSTDRIFFSDQNGQIIRSLNFNRDETIILPGINSSNLQATWITDGDLIRFSIDSMSYPFSTFDPNIFARSDSVQNEEIINRLKEFDEPLKVYGQVFTYTISRDTLRLFSTDVKLWAVRDRRIDDMFKNW